MGTAAQAAHPDPRWRAEAAVVRCGLTGLSIPPREHPPRLDTGPTSPLA